MPNSQSEDSEVSGATQADNYFDWLTSPRTKGSPQIYPPVIGLGTIFDLTMYMYMYM